MCTRARTPLRPIHPAHATYSPPLHIPPPTRRPHSAHPARATTRAKKNFKPLTYLLPPLYPSPLPSPPTSSSPLPTPTLSPPPNLRPINACSHLILN